MSKGQACGGQIIATIEDVEEQFFDLRNTTTLPEIKKRTWSVQPLAAGIRRFSAFSFPSLGVVRYYARFQGEYEDQQLCPLWTRFFFLAGVLFAVLLTPS